MVNVQMVIRLMLSRLFANRFNMYLVVETEVEVLEMALMLEQTASGNRRLPTPQFTFSLRLLRL